MAAPTDTTIRDWANDYGGADTNEPQGGTTIGTHLDDHMRVVRSVVRDESIDKQWEQHAGLITGFTQVDSDTFKVSGDQTSVYEVGRRVRIENNGSFIYGVITASSHAAGPDETTVDVTIDDGTNIDASATRADVSAITQSNSAITPGKVKRQVFTSNGTWTKPAGCRYVDVEVQGAGGGSGGAPATGTGEAAESGAGAGGGYAKKAIDVTGISSSTVTVGSGGSGGASSGGDGSSGGQSKWADGTNTLTANGGGGGNGTSATSGNSAVVGGTGGTASGGDYNVQGGDGNAGKVQGGLNQNNALGGNSQLGSVSADAETTVGAAGHDYGGGAGGISKGASIGARTGGAGGDGIVLVTEYY